MLQWGLSQIAAFGRKIRKDCPVLDITYSLALVLFFLVLMAAVMWARYRIRYSPGRPSSRENASQYASDARPDDAAVFHAAPLAIVIGATLVVLGQAILSSGHSYISCFKGV